MANDAHLRASLTLDTNIDEAAKRAAQGFDHMTGAAAKARDALVKSIEKGDPLKALERQMAREIQAVEKHAAKSEELAKLAEEAKTAIVERYAERRIALEEQAAAAAKKAATESTRQLVAMKGPLNDTVGLMSTLAGTTDSAISQVANLGKTGLSALGAGGPLAIGLAAVSAGVLALTTHLTEAREAAEKAAAATVKEWTDANTAVAAQVEQLKEVVRLKRLALDGGSAEGERAAATRGAAVLQEADATRALTRAEGELAAARQRATDAREEAALAASMGARPSTGPIREAEQAIKDLEAKTFAARAAVADARSARRDAETAEALLATALYDEEEKRKAEEAKRKRKSGRPDVEGGDVYGAAIARARADEEMLERAGRDALVKASKLRVDAQKEVAAAMAAMSPLAGLDHKMKLELDAIEARMKEAVRLAADPDVRAEAEAAQAALEEARLSVTKRFAEERRQVIEKEARESAAAAKTLRDEGLRKARLDERAEKESVRAGLAAGDAFAKGFKSALDAKSDRDLFSGLWNMATALVALVPGGQTAAGAMQIAGGFFETGGTPFAHHLPQGRNGLAVMPGLNFDAKPAWLHEQEVVMPKPVVQDTFGGLPEAMRIAAGGPLPGGGAGPTSVTVYNSAFGPVTSREAMGLMMEPAIIERGQHRASPLLVEAQRRTLQKRIGR